MLLSLGLSGLALRRLADLHQRGARRPVAGPEAPVAAALQAVGLVRFRAYNDVGGDHSFALALVDAAGTGVVILSLYHRERCRVYAKPLRHWTAPIALTDEERLAVERARSGDETVDMVGDGR
ncbi:MAG: hypothetical protein NVS9B1_14360 [Candidatus Dormibacteraceae bacterium]